MSDFVQVTNASNISVPIVLFKDQQYKIIFVAQHVSGNTYTYTVDGEGNMSLNPQAAITDGEQLDAFVYWEDTGIIKNDYKRNITLTRPLAQINITTEAAVKPTSIDVEVSGIAQSYNIFNSTYTAPDAKVSLTNLQCTGASLGTVYFLTAPGSVQVKMVMKYNNGNPDKTVIHITGDGSFGMNLTELATEKREKLPVVTVLFNNSALGLVRQNQKLHYGKRYSQTDLKAATDYKALAAAFGMRAAQAENIEQFEKALIAFSADNKGGIIECIINKDDYIRPMLEKGRLIY
jgi:hypothetical protein